VKRSRIAVALSSALALSGCDHASAERKETAPDAKRVVVVRPVHQAIARSVTQPAEVIALNKATLYAQVAGYLNEITVDKGDPIEKGEVLATIAVPELEAEEKQLIATRGQAEAELAASNVELERVETTRLAAEAGVTRARVDVDLQKELYDRTKALFQDNAVPREELEIAEGHSKEADASLALAGAKLKETEAAKREAASRIEVAKAKVMTAQAALDRVEARLAYSKIRAPFKGFVAMRFVDPGEMIQQATASSTAQRILDVVEIDRVRVDFPMPEAEVAHVATGQSVRLHPYAWPGRTFECRVARFSAALDPATRTLLVEAEYDNAGTELRPGMYGDAVIELERRNDALALPAEAVRHFEGKRTVWVVEGGVAHRRVVEPGLDSGASIEIKSGLSGNETVVLGGRLTEGAVVIAVERKAEEHAEKSE
jgi:RND family efflux transporter MFP subunit